MCEKKEKRKKSSQSYHQYENMNNMNIFPSLKRQYFIEPKLLYLKTLTTWRYWYESHIKGTSGLGPVINRGPVKNSGICFYSTFTCSTTQL